MTIIVDQREPKDIQSIGDKVEWLDFGDIIIDTEKGKFIMERKTFNDYWSSLTQGRLHEQLENSDALLLDVRGGFDKFYALQKASSEEDKQKVYEKLWDTINGISLHHSVIFFLSNDQLNRMLRRYQDQITKGTFKHFRKPIVKKDIPTKVRVLASFDGVGEERARALLRAHGNKLIDALQAALEYDGAVGVGGISLQQIIDALLDDSEV